MTMRLRPAAIAAALLVMTACTSGGAVATTEFTVASAPTTNAPTTSAPSTTTVPTTLTTPTTVPTTVPTRTTVLEPAPSEISIARTFFHARNVNDEESATALFAPDAHYHGGFITSVDMYPALFDWLRAHWLAVDG